MTIETIVSIGLMVFMLGAVVLNEVAYRRKVRAYVVRERKRELEDTLRLIGLGARETDR